MKVLVFHDGALYGEYEYLPNNPFKKIRGEIPKGSYIYFPIDPWYKHPKWYRSDFTPVLLVDVPLNYRAMALIYT